MKIWLYEKWDFVTNNIFHLCHKHSNNEDWHSNMIIMNIKVINQINLI